MTKFASTSPSSSEIEQRIKALLPPGDRTFLFARDDELQRYEAATAHARKVRTETIEAGIMDCYAHHRLRFRDYPPVQHTQQLRNVLEEEYFLFGLTDPPSLPTIRRVLREHSSLLADVPSACD